MGIRNAIALAVLLTCTAIAVPTARAQKRSEPLPTERPSGCPVTTAAEAFIPPAPYRSQARAGTIFVGTPKLWTQIVFGGRISSQYPENGLVESRERSKTTWVARPDGNIQAA
jgi:hypothetical protein